MKTTITIATHKECPISAWRDDFDDDGNITSTTRYKSESEALDAVQALGLKQTQANAWNGEQCSFLGDRVPGSGTEWVYE